MLKVTKGEIELNGVNGFAIRKTALRVFDGRGKIDGWKIEHSVYGNMDLVGEDRKELLKRLLKEAGSNPELFARNRFMKLQACENLRASMNRQIGL